MTRNRLSPRSVRLAEAILIEAPPDEVFAQWMRLEELPLLLECVRRVKCLDERRSLWDVDLAGRQLVWEAHIVEQVPGKLLRWESSRGATHSGRMTFQALPNGRTRLEVEIDVVPGSLIEWLAARLGWVSVHVRFDLGRFREFVESLPEHAKLA